MHIRPHISHYLLMTMATFVLVFAFTVYAKEYGVSERSLAVSGNDSFNETQIFDFVVSGGDVISPSSPLKSYISVEGLYSGEGSVLAYYDGNEDSGEVFNLPDQGGISSMQFVLGDKLGLLNSDNAGSYSHKLYVKPQGVVIHSFSAHLSTSYGRDVGNKCEDGNPTTEKTKTIQSWVANEESINSSKTYTINYGLNDDLLNITDPISSAYIEVIGLYSGSGNATIYFNDENVDGVSYELPLSSSQKIVSLLSRDIKNLIVKESGTDFSQNFTVSVNGTSLDNVSIKFVLTYKYHPMKSSCGGLPATGEYISPTLDTRSPKGVIYNSITWRGVLGGDLKDIGKVRFQLAVSKCQNGAENPPLCNIGTWKYIGGPTCSNSDWFESKGPDSPIDLYKTGCGDLFSGNQYYRYKVQLCSKDCVEIGQSTPVIDEVFVSWSP